MHRMAANLSGRGLTVESISLEGGIPTEPAIKKLVEALKGVEGGADTAVVFDVFGNFCYRFIQADGSLALPVMLGGKHHLLGDLEIVQEGAFKGLVAKLMEVFATVKQAVKIVLPPLPRYVGGSYCEDVGHANNSRVLKEQVVKGGIENIWMPGYNGGAVW